MAGEVGCPTTEGGGIYQRQHDLDLESRDTLFFRANRLFPLEDLRLRLRFRHLSYATRIAPRLLHHRRVLWQHTRLTTNIMARDRRSTMDKVRDLFGSKKSGSSDDQCYEPIAVEEGDNDDVYRPVTIIPEDSEQPFSWIEYCIFVLLGIAMLWAW